jgi:hypothetical protein
MLFSVCNRFSGDPSASRAKSVSNSRYPVIDLIVVFSEISHSAVNEEPKISYSEPVGPVALLFVRSPLKKRLSYKGVPNGKLGNSANAANAGFVEPAKGLPPTRLL